MLNLDKAEDRATLMEFYQLKSLSPSDYQKDTIQSKFKIDLSNEDLSSIPKEFVNQLLGDNMNDSHSTSPAFNARSNSVKKKTLSSGKSHYSDALGFHQNILDELIDKDILDDTRDPQLNKFMVDSKLFNPKLFLSVIHGDKSLNELIIGIKHLENDINAKKPQLQQLITQNFEKTLSSKNSLDKVYNEFSSSNLGDEINVLNTNLASSNNSTNQLLNPVLLLLSKEQELSNALAFIKTNKFFLDLPKKLKSYIDEDDFDSVLKEYERGFVFFQNIKSSKDKNPLFDKIWSNVTKVIEDYKTSMLDELKSVHIELISNNFKLQINSKKKNFVVLTKRIIELSPKENPIKGFIDCQYQYILKDLDNGLATINFERLFNARNSILNAYKTNSDSDQNLSETLLTATLSRLFNILSSSSFNEEQITALYQKLDSPLVVHLWNYVLNYIDDFTDKVIGEKILKFESIVEFFLNDFNALLSKKAQMNSFKMDNNDLLDMRKYFRAMISKICSRLTFAFSCTSSDLTNALALTVQHGPGAVFPDVGEKNVDDPSTYGFIPPNSNSISTLCYSVKIFNMVYNKLSELQNEELILSAKEISSEVVTTVVTINKNVITGCLSTLIHDIKEICFVDTMIPNDQIDGATKLITFVKNYYKIFISKLHEIYVLDSKDLKTIIETQFLRSFDSLLSGMVNNIHRQSELDPTRVDYFYLATIYNMRNLTQRTIPSILKSFDINFNSNLSSNKDLQIFKDFDKYEYALFSEYMREPLSTIKEIVTQGITEMNFTSVGVLNKLASSEPIEVSDYIMKTINYVNNLKSKLLSFKIRNSFILDVQSTLIGQLQKKIIDNLNIEFTDDSIFQLTLDINLLIKVLKKFNEKSPPSNITDTGRLEDAYKKLIAKTDSSSVDKNTEVNINYNYTQFVCFTTC